MNRGHKFFNLMRNFENSATCIYQEDNDNTETGSKKRTKCANCVYTGKTCLSCVKAEAKDKLNARGKLRENYTGKLWVTTIPMISQAKIYRRDWIAGGKI